MNGEYTTVNAVRQHYLNSVQTGDDALILSFVREVTAEINAITNRSFVPRIETRYYDTPARGQDLYLDSDLLELTTLTNGDGSAMTTSVYKLYPLNKYPKNHITLLSGHTWALAGGIDPYGAISLAGVWGVHSDYPSAWQPTGAVLTAAITDPTATVIKATTGQLIAGDLIKIDNEYLYVVSVTTGTEDSVITVRGANGSTAVTHLIAAPVSRWQVSPEIEMLARQAAAGYYKLKSNPMLDTVTLDGVTFVTPKDVIAYMSKRLDQLAGVQREGIG